MYRSNLKNRSDETVLAEALSIAWNLLVAADHPATHSNIADEVRKRMAERIKQSAVMATDGDDLWVAALNEVQCDSRTVRSPTALLARIWNMSEAV